MRNELCRAIEGPIRKRCKAFVQLNSHEGRGVRDRILELFDELADETIDAAKPPAQKVLLDNYRTVEQEIVEAWRIHNDPLAAAADAIVSSHEDSVKRSDDQKRKKILETILEITECSPPMS